MRRDWNQHPAVVAVLFMALVGVWATVWVRAQTDQHVAMSAPQSKAPKAEAAPRFAELPFPDVPHDPFSPQAFEPDSNPTEPDEPPSAAQKPRHRLQGVIGSTALLLDPDGEAHLVRRGDALGEVEVVRVHPGHVDVQLNGHTFELTLE